MGIRMLVLLVGLCLLVPPAFAEEGECFDSAAVVDMATARRGVVMAVDRDGRVGVMYPDGECAVLASVPDTPSCLAVSPGGVVFVGSALAGTVWRVLPTGRTERLAEGLSGLTSLIVDRDGVVLAAISGQSAPLRLSRLVEQ